MIAGIGVDMVSIPELERLCTSKVVGDAFMKRTFTQAERDAANVRPNPYEHLAGCFAAKEAVFKAIADLLPERAFDLRMVELLNHESGSPFVNGEGPLSGVLADAGVCHIHISLTNENECALAFVVAERV